MYSLGSTHGAVGTAVVASTTIVSQQSVVPTNSCSNKFATITNTNGHEANHASSPSKMLAPDFPFPTCLFFFKRGKVLKVQIELDASCLTHVLSIYMRGYN